MSYGDYISSIDLESIGQCLITGQIIEEGDKASYDDSDTSNLKKSNGSGKSALVNVVQWVIFGRTMHSSNPGDAIINYFTGKDCYGKVTFKNGDYIIRTRKSSGGNELIYCKAGDETKLNADTLSTTKNMQAHLNKAFKLDYDLFCGSVFFNQYSKPWLEMAENTRKKALERMLRVDRFAYYAKTAKQKMDGAENLNNQHLSKYNSTKDSLQIYEEQKENIKESVENFDTNKKKRQADLQDEIREIEAKIERTEVPDIAKLEKKWDIILQIQKQLSVLSTQEQKKKLDLRSKEQDKLKLSSTADEWKSKSGKMCVSCKQTIEAGHTSSIIDPLLEKIDILESEIIDLKKEIKGLQDSIKKINDGLVDKTPKLTVKQAQDIIDTIKQYKKSIDKLKQRIQDIDKEKNPHLTSIEEIDSKIRTLQQQLTSYEVKIDKNNFLIKHMNYIYKAYNDRNKIKSEVFKEHIPFINGRLKHYLDVFGLDISIELTENLGIKSDKWGYDFESGGERKRTDVAFMLATFDFHEYMFGRQCNLLVLDEVDGRLDDDGINGLINIIKNDIASKVETVLIISHRPDMHDIFPSQINIIRENRMSRIESISR